MPNINPGNALWGITSYFNPEQYKTKYKNYKKFRESSQKQGLPLIVVECAFSNTPFELSQDDADILVQVRCNSVLWQKERLLNIALKHLPPECTKVAWLDADILFLNENWISETVKLLDEYRVVQLFDMSVRLKKNQIFTKLEEYKFGDKNGNKRSGYAYVRCSNNPSHYFAPGFAWGIRRDIIAELGFFDTGILGGGDSVMIQGFLGEDLEYAIFYNHALNRDGALWIQKMRHLIGGRVYYVSGTILHLFHGEIKKRYYSTRYKLIKAFDFDPKRDIVKNQDGCWEWNTHNTALKKVVENYFSLRNEDARIHLKCYFYFRNFKNRSFSRVLYHLMIQVVSSFKQKNPRIYYPLRNIFFQITKK